MKRVTIIVPECQVNLNSVGGAYDILRIANDIWQKQGHPAKLNIDIAAFSPEIKSHNNYLAILPKDIREIERTDLILIPALLGEYENAIQNNQKLIDWIAAQYRLGAEIASMCSGAFLLAATGLLNGRNCSTHWSRVDDFHKMYPEVHITQDKIITEDNGIYTNGGAYSFLNLIIYLVEKLFDRNIAIFCSKYFQIDIERATQSPFAIFRMQKKHGDQIVDQAQTYIEQHLDAKISFEKLAADLAISRRNFDRRFVKATGNTPMEYLQRVKIEAAKKELENGRKSVFEVMNDVGYADDKAFREVFKKITGLSPLDYRNKYNSGRSVG
ncbi:GlxA family transcriptional regulator [Taibaiella soli]|uniref:AraC family transcriptional regulator n=1 Tax=Taibaiella soli TaxID=1649169 RepID=A0A2W2B4H7_9BACT|nr:helix-turn-helix domain-containing protein [Taibaiella soli]PZF71169.1 AraC family transcriptional regulator [Taibaiella soli]